MDELVKKRVRNLLLISDADVKAAKLIVRLPEKDGTKKLACHIREVMHNMQEVMSLIEDKDVSQSEMFPGPGVVVGLDPESATQGRVVYTTKPEQEVKEED